ncbi:MAG TPA: alanine--tRNA ligase [Acidimicrobiia bacterium]|jgi:alanyl-tRNA synthetase|nr:alanine--tRNA ligase [Acidimicrobiia bacterium]HEV3451951.1 alanine--tRNA ligase [Acidimicrobiia bacterium]
MAPRTAGELRLAFLDFFAARGHVIVPSAALIPHDPTVLFTVAGMVPFKPYFVGDEAPPWPRAASIQKCVRAGGKHNDLDDIGRTNRHFSFFEMLGNFSFGDYFKAETIPWAWEFLTEVLELDPERLWVTVHVSDDDADGIWRREVGLPPARIQRLDEENVWRMGDTGPCGLSSELFWDLGDDFGPGGGPAQSPDRYIELWNLVFMQFDQRVDGQVPLPRPSIDTGAGLERNLMALQGVDSIFDIDVFAPLVQTAERVTGVTYGRKPDLDVSLRILAEHARTMTFLVADGVVPSNEERGYVLRRIIRRAVRHAFLLGAQQVVTPTLAEATIEVMGDAYPEIVSQRDLVTRTVEREEERFRQTLERGLEVLDDLLAKGDVGGGDAFFLHDTLGFPIDLTREVAGERGRTVDGAGFEARMEEQRSRAAAARKATGGEVGTAAYRALLEEVGPTEFTGRVEYETPDAAVQALVVGDRRVDRAADGEVDVVLDRTPFYAEAGGQVGDTGVLLGPNGRVRVVDTTYALPGLVAHHGRLEEGEIAAGDLVTARIDADRRDRIRRNHTATHILHWALREVLGPHVKQAGSLVAPDRLRFDFSHDRAVTVEELDRVEALANAEIITDAPVRHYETTKEHAEALGAIAFFGDKYGDLVRVLEAGEHSLELCGGTHVHALGFIGPIKIVSESSIGANLRRIEAVTGADALARIHDEERALRAAATALRVKPEELPGRVERLRDEVRALQAELSAQRARGAVAEASDLAAAAVDGVVVDRRDGRGADELRALAVAARDALGGGVVGLVGAGPDGASATVVVAVSADLVGRGVTASEIARPVAAVLGGGTGKAPDVAVGGGRNVAALDEARAVLERSARDARGPADA